MKIREPILQQPSQSARVYESLNRAFSIAVPILLYRGRFWVRIPTGSRRLAWEWSLVLLSQGIEPVLLRSVEHQSWVLLVLPEQFDWAWQVLHQYVEENRDWAQQLSPSQMDLQLHWAVLPWCFVLAFLYWADLQSGGSLTAAGAMTLEGIRSGQWWRLITATMLHADIGHLMSNLAFGLFFLGIAMRSYGAGLGFVLALLSGAFANGVGAILRVHPYIGLGASGVVMASIGLLAAWSIIFARQTVRLRRRIWVGAVATLFLLIMFGLAPQTDVLVHVSGFFIGMGSGLFIGFWQPTLLLRPKEHWGLLSCGWLLLLGSWFWALWRMG